MVTNMRMYVNQTPKCSQVSDRWAEQLSQVRNPKHNFSEIFESLLIYVAGAPAASGRVSQCVMGPKPSQNHRKCSYKQQSSPWKPLWLEDSCQSSFRRTAVAVVASDFSSSILEINASSLSLHLFSSYQRLFLLLDLYFYGALIKFISSLCCPAEGHLLWRHSETHKRSDGAICWQTPGKQLLLFYRLDHWASFISPLLFCPFFLSFFFCDFAFLFLGGKIQTVP